MACGHPARASVPPARTRLLHWSATDTGWDAVREGFEAEVADAIAQSVDEPRSATRTRWREPVEIIEAVFLAIVAIATAWSGYQAARWDGHQAERYGHSGTLRITGDEFLTLGGQQRLLDVSTLNTWIEARVAGNDDLADLYERRFSPEYRVAFQEWLATDPLDNPNAPPGPSFMPSYENPLIERGRELNDRATRVFAEGTAARLQADDYVRTTVVLATVLFLLALSQRFRLPHVRIGILIVAAGLMLYGLVAIATFPRM
jgi:hypothetical protein